MNFERNSSAVFLEADYSAKLHFLRFGIFHTKSIYCYFYHDLIFYRSVLSVCFGCSNFIYHIHTFDHFTKRRILTIQMRTCFVHDEELGTCTVRMHGTSHRQHTGCVFQVVFESSPAEFTCDMVAGPPMPVPSGQPPWIIKPRITRWKILPS